MQAILNKVVARFLLHQFREKQNYGTIQLQGTAGETLEMTLALCTSPQKSYRDLKEIDTIPDASSVSSVLVRSTFVKGSSV